MIGELAAAIPAEGGFYVWVRRGLGPFWGYQESWLSLTASIFDMALYPSIFVLYLGKFSPALTAGWRGYLWSLAVVVLCCAWNLRGAPSVGEDSVWLFALLLAPFVVFVVLGFWRGFTLHPAMHWGRSASAPGADAGLSTAILVALWNYMGWDNASTIARDVENPQRNYPRAMIAAAILTAFTYVLPLAAMAVAGLSPAGFSTGSWAIAGGAIGGPILAMADRCRRRHLRHRHVQRAHDELHPPAHRHGRRRHVAAHLPAPQPPRRSLGQRARLRAWLGARAQSALRAPHLHRPDSLWLEPASSNSSRSSRCAFASRTFRVPSAPATSPLPVCSAWAPPSSSPTRSTSRAAKSLAIRTLALANVSALLFASVIALLGPLLYWLTAAPLARRAAQVANPRQSSALHRTAQGPKKALMHAISLCSLFLVPSPCFYTATFFFVS